MNNKVTDPSLLNKLNSNGMKKVTDPSLLKKLNSEAQENPLQKFIRYGLKDPAIGILNMGREFANLPNKISGGRIPELSPSDFNFGETLGVNNPDSGDKLIQMLGQYGPSMALPGANIGKLGKLLGSAPKVGKYASKAISEAIPQALYGAAQAPQNNIKAGAEAGATMAPFSVLAQLMQSTNPKVKNIARILCKSYRNW